MIDAERTIEEEYHAWMPGGITESSRVGGDQENVVGGDSGGGTNRSSLAVTRS